MSDSERVYKMDEAARVKNREAQQRFRLRRKLKEGDARAIGSDMGTPDAGSWSLRRRKRQPGITFLPKDK
jgi:hypothetical protein